jgi:hypothetical protein
MPLADDPLRRIGVYKTVEQVPDHYRLGNYESMYQERDLWEAYCEAELADAAETVRDRADLVGRRWTEHMQDRERHHALAWPDDVEAWFQKLTARLSLKRAYTPYWVRLDDFYTYLMWHCDFPHVYHPPRMAAGQEGATEEIWEFRLAEAKQ